MDNQNPNPEARYAPPPPSRRPFDKNPLLASILSVFPGLGNIYNGLYLRGLAFAAVCVGIFATAIATGGGRDLGLLIPALVFFWLFNIFDAYRQATLINFGPEPAAEVPSALSAAGQASGGLTLGVAILVIGLYGLLRHVLPDLDLSILVDYWYFGFLAFGAWLVYHAARERRRLKVEQQDGELEIGEAISGDASASSEAA